MHIERIRPAVLQVRLSVIELAALISAARWAAEGGQGELDAAAREQLREVLRSYESSIAAANTGPGAT